MKDRIIRASEIGQYSYCARAWWLARVKGLSPRNVEELEHGQVEHHRHSRAVSGYHRLRRWAYLLLISAALAGLLLLWWVAKGY
jgi:hypothetical protein